MESNTKFYDEPTTTMFAFQAQSRLTSSIMQQKHYILYNKFASIDNGNMARKAILTSITSILIISWSTWDT